MFRHIGIVVKDIDKQIKFYRDLLGLEIYYNQIEGDKYLQTLLGFDNATAKVIKLGKDNKILVELLSFNTDSDINNKKIYECGITHFALTVSNLEYLYVNMTKNKVEFISKPVITVDGKHKVCFCKDYENNYLELVEVL